ncbi:MAG TPA: hypothetical protein VFI42_05105 [Thermomicrobiaceae bacterium]|nr:hypothetical protein [Thermomicrobiaceae bacterium]
MPRFAIRRAPIWRPLLALFGATAGHSWVDVEPDKVVAQFGSYHLEIPRDNIEQAERGAWPWLGGIGWRVGLGGTLGLIGSMDGVVHLHLRQPQRRRLLGIPIRVRNVYVSLEDPNGFLAALEA